MEDSSLQKNTQNDVVESNSTQLLQPKQKDSDSDYFSERIKRLTTAVYLVTNSIPQTDPLRLSIRKFSIRLLSFFGLAHSGYSLVETATEVKNLCKKITEMLEIAFFSGYVSEMNFSVLKSEFDAFMNEISDQGKFQAQLSPDSLKVGFVPAQTSAPRVTISPKVQKPSILPSQLKPVVIDKKQVPSRTAVEAKKVSRKEAILSIIRRRGGVSIKDISAVIIDCSEKTIQRELMALVEEGTLKKSGERRWSIYSLVE